MMVRGFLKRTQRWRHIGRRRIRVVRKLDESKVKWIILQKKAGKTTNRQIADTMGISEIWVKKLWARYKGVEPDRIVYPASMGRPENGLPGRREHSAVLSAHCRHRQGAVRTERLIEGEEGIHIPHNAVHGIMRDNGLSVRQPKKSKRRKWIRFERTYSNSMWHTDYKQLDDGRWFIAYLDDASRFIVGYGVFDQATSRHAIDVLRAAMEAHGKPASILTDRGSQFYANEGQYKKKGASEFERELVSLGIRQILARVRHPQTNGKLEGVHGELQRKLHLFEEESADRTVRSAGSETDRVGGPFNTKPKTDPVERFVEWFNHDRPHMSLDLDNLETPAQAFTRKMPSLGQTVIDEQTGEEYDVR